MTYYKVLLIDQKSDVSEVLSPLFGKEGYVVETSDDGIEGLKKAKLILPDVIILEVLLPEINGLEVCKRIRKDPKLSHSLIIFLSSKTDEITQLQAFDAGANDFILKPFNPKIVVRKIKALLHLKSQEVVDKIIDLQDLTINRNTYKVSYNQQKLNLPRKEFELLSLLASSPERVFKREEILEKVWGNEVIVSGRTIDVHIRKLREKFGDQRFTTIKGVGYKLNL